MIADIPGAQTVKRAVYTRDFNFLSGEFDGDNWLGPPVVGLDIETEGVLSAWDGEVATTQVDLESACYVVHWGPELTLATVPGVAWFRRFLGCPDVTKAIHNATFEQQHFLRAFGLNFRVAPIHDTRIGEYDLAEGRFDPNERKHRFSLAECVRKRYGIEMDKDPALRTGFMRGEELTDRQRNYAAFDAIWATRLAIDQLRDMSSLYDQGVPIFQTFRRDVAQTAPIARMALRGMPCSRSKLADLSTGWRAEIAGLEQQIHDALWLPEDDLPTGKTGRGRPKPLKINSPVEMPRRLNRVFGLSLYGFEAEDLKRHRQIPVIEAILRHKRLTKLDSTYAGPLQDKIKFTGRIHADYDPAYTTTGRAAMGGFGDKGSGNLQNLPKRTPEGAQVRECFVADPGYTFVFADFSNIELRLIAEIFDDANMLRAFAEDYDLHCFTAAMLLYDVQNPTWEGMQGPYREFLARYAAGDAEAKRARQNAKPLNFGLGYGAGAQQLKDIAWREHDLNWPLEEAGKKRDAWLRLYSGVHAYHERRKRELRYGAGLFVVQSTDGRRRWVDRQGGYSESLNHPIQSTSAEMTKQSHIELDGAGVPIVLVVHDELIAHVRIAEAERTAAFMKETMERVGKGYLPRIPCVVDPRSETYWKVS